MNKSKWIESLRTVLLVWMLTVALGAAAQSSRPLTLDFKNEALSSVLKKIEDASNYKVLFSYDAVKPYKVTTSVKGLEAVEAVKKVIAPFPLSMTVTDNFITVARKEDKTAASTNNRRITGYVTDTQKETLIGASITVPGSPFGTITDANGFFELTLPQYITSMQVSYVGMKTETVELTAKNKMLYVVLTEDNTLLDDVVVTGYQTISKERATGSFVKVTSEDLQSKRLNTISSLLEGEVAGYTSDGTLRGVSTMYGETSPLYVIDGFPVENQVMDYQGSVTTQLPELNMEDIESITVLKDAAAASIYGARAANGVIVITTKSGSKGEKLDVNFSATLTWSPYRYYTGHLASAADYISLEKE